MEEWGSGYKRVVRVCRSGGYPQPEWHELGAVMRVVFYPHPEVMEQTPRDVPVNDRQKWFLVQPASGKKCRISDLARHWGVSEKTAKRDIAYLKQKGVIAFMGAPKNGSYYLT